ncbi:unnamed protein product [Trichogramma brassicae]|uniref:Uncharacterized protein n=1 Tax=Trichogramma brassicae TaxID=86971 RepID=A0A6H5ICY7_9HYME|nr:unnamed protein product [Trichogramma brassicae]
MRPHRLSSATQSAERAAEQTSGAASGPTHKDALLGNAPSPPPAPAYINRRAAVVRQIRLRPKRATHREHTSRSHRYTVAAGPVGHQAEEDSQHSCEVHLRTPARRCHALYIEKLGWLTPALRRDYFLGMEVQRTTLSGRPPYLIDLLPVRRVSTRALRLTTVTAFQQERISTKTYGNGFLHAHFAKVNYSWTTITAVTLALTKIPFYTLHRHQQLVFGIVHLKSYAQRQLLFAQHLSAGPIFRVKERPSKEPRKLYTLTKRRRFSLIGARYRLLVCY